MRPFPLILPGRLRSALFFLSLMAVSGAVNAQQLHEAQPLKVGQFLWAASDIPDKERLSITISIARQRLYVYDGNRLAGMSTVSTGMRGHATPLGTFNILQKREWHSSNLYSNAPMPYMQRLTWDGIAIHAGALPGYPASHGCIRLPLAFARQLFAITSSGTSVTIVDDYQVPSIQLQFADIEWEAGDDALSVPPERYARMASVAPTKMPHWASKAEIERVRSASRVPPLELAPIQE